VSADPAAESAYLEAALDAAHVASRFLHWMEDAAEQLAPQRSAALAADAQRQHAGPLAAARTALAAAPAPEELLPFAERLAAGMHHVERAFVLFAHFPEAPAHERIPRILGALHEVARAQEMFYAIRRVVPPFHDYWRLPDTPSEGEPQQADASAPLGVVHVSHGDRHGGFALYVPETYRADRDWPVIVALHGGSGNGSDFLWTWVREAKSLGYVLIAPSSVADTWSEVEDAGLLEILEWTAACYRLARDRILLTGLSDGATFGLLYGLAHPDVYRAIAPLCGVLHPANAPLGNLERARDKPIYLVHGALDFLFPVALARLARDTLTDAGARLEYRELPELSHTYPRSENVRILRWFEAITAA